MMLHTTIVICYHVYHYIASYHHHVFFVKHTIMMLHTTIMIPYNAHHYNAALRLLIPLKRSTIHKGA